jgi:hypothetical protein
MVSNAARPMTKVGHHPFRFGSIGDITSNCNSLLRLHVLKIYSEPIRLTPFIYDHEKL